MHNFEYHCNDFPALLQDIGIRSNTLYSFRILTESKWILFIFQKKSKGRTRECQGLVFSDEELRDIKKQLIEWGIVKWQNRFNDFEELFLNAALQQNLHKKRII